jgi:hypothetical protein
MYMSTHLPVCQSLVRLSTVYSRTKPNIEILPPHIYDYHALAWYPTGYCGWHARPLDLNPDEYVHSLYPDYAGPGSSADG